MAEYYSIVYMYHIFFIHLSVDGHLGCFHVFQPALLNCLLGLLWGQCQGDNVKTSRRQEHYERVKGRTPQNWYTYTCPSTHIHMYAHMHTHTHPRVHTHTLSHVCTHINVLYLPTLTLVHTHAHTSEHTHTHIHTHIPNNTCTHRHIHSHTFTHSHPYSHKLMHTHHKHAWNTHSYTHLHTPTQVRIYTCTYIILHHYGSLKWSLEMDALLFSHCYPLHCVQKPDIWTESHLLPLPRSWAAYWAAGSLMAPTQGTGFIANSRPRTSVWEPGGKYDTLGSPAGKSEAGKGSESCPRSSRKVTGD